MALITSGVGAVVVFSSGNADRIALVGLRNVTTGDTLDVGVNGLDVLSFVNRAVLMSVTSFVEIAGAWNGTIVTMPAGLTNDAAYLLAWGSGT
jgi:hypothetical protein